MPALLPGRAAEEQLCELTRLVLKLPEVDGLLQRAGLQPIANRLEPTSALELFVKVQCGVLMVSTKENPVYLEQISLGLLDIACRQQQ